MLEDHQAIHAVLLTKHQVMEDKENVHFLNSRFVLVFSSKDGNRNEGKADQTPVRETDIPEVSYNVSVSCLSS